MVTRKRKSKGSGRATSRDPIEFHAQSEKIVPIPAVAVFSELPFKKVGVIGGRAIPAKKVDSSEARSDGPSPVRGTRKGGTARPVGQATSKGVKKPVRRKKAK